MAIRVTKKALAAKAADDNKAVALKAAGLTENATAAEVVKLFKQTIGEGEKSVRDIMRKLAELAGLLVEGYGLTQEQVAEKVGRSQPWVSGILRWRRDGYKLVAFGPETHKPKLLPANNPAPAPQVETVRTATGDKIDTSQFGPKAQKQLARVTGDEGAVSIEDRQAHNAKLAILDELGITAEQAGEWVALAKLSEAEFRAHVESVIKGNAKPPTPTTADPVKTFEGPKDGPVVETQPKETLEECLARMVAEAADAKSVVPAHTVCVRCMEYLLPLMNTPTRQQMRKEFDLYGNKIDKAEKKAA
jgi:hypothetical protein